MFVYYVFYVGLSKVLKPIILIQILLIFNKV